MLTRPFFCFLAWAYNKTESACCTPINRNPRNSYLLQSARTRTTLTGMKLFIIICVDTFGNVCGLLLTNQLWVNLRSQVKLAQKRSSRVCDGLVAKHQVHVGTDILTSRIHLLRPVSNLNSSPSSLSKIQQLSSRDQEMRGSLSNSAGSVRNPVNPVELPVEPPAS